MTELLKSQVQADLYVDRRRAEPGLLPKIGVTSPAGWGAGTYSLAFAKDQFCCHSSSVPPASSSGNPTHRLMAPASSHPCFLVSGKQSEAPGSGDLACRLAIRDCNTQAHPAWLPSSPSSPGCVMDTFGDFSHRRFCSSTPGHTGAIPSPWNPLHLPPPPRPLLQLTRPTPSYSSGHSSDGLSPSPPVHTAGSMLLVVALVLLYGAASLPAFPRAPSFTLPCLIPAPWTAPDTAWILMA